MNFYNLNHSFLFLFKQQQQAQVLHPLVSVHTFDNYYANVLKYQFETEMIADF